MLNNLNSINKLNPLQISGSMLVNDTQKIENINSILNDFSQGTLSLSDVISKLKDLGITAEITTSGIQTTVTVTYNGKTYTGINLSKTTPTNNYLDTNNTIIDNYIIETIQTSSSFTNLYRKKVLLEKYGFSEEEIAKYFCKHLTLYKLSMQAISKDFPNIKISTAEELKTLLECGVTAFKNRQEIQTVLENLPDEKVSKSELKAILEDFINILKKDLKSKNYSYDYINSILNFATEKVFNLLENNASPKEVASQILDIISDITGETNLVYMKEKGIGKNKKEVNFFEDKEKMKSHTLDNNLEDILANGNTQAQYFAKILTDAISSLNLTEREREIFLQRVFDAIGKKIDNYTKGLTKINFSSLTKLDKNNDGSWLDEFHKIVQEEMSKINPNVNRNPQTIDANELTNLLGRLSPEDFVENLDDLLLSNDSGVRKFAQMIEEALDKFGVCNEYEQNQLIGYIFKLLNESAGRTSSNVLKRATIERLNNKDIFKELEKIINSDRLELLYELDYDGEIGDFMQQSTGDCWLLSGILSLNATKEGRKILEEALTFNPDNSVTVHFKGLNVSYTITPEEILEAQALSESYNRTYTSGDNDVLIFELATEKLRRDIMAGKVKMPPEEYFGYHEDNGNPGGGIEGGRTKQFIYFLTGKKSDTLSASNDKEVLNINKIKDFCLKRLKDFKQGTVSLSFSCLYNIHSATTVDGEVFKASLGNYGHGYAITDMTESTITIVDPHNSKKEYTFTWEEFAKFGIFAIEATDLN